MDLTGEFLVQKILKGKIIQIYDWWRKNDQS